MKSTFKLIQVLDNLSRIPRSGGVLFSGIDPNYGDSLAEHSYKVTWLVLLFAAKLKKLGIKLNESNLLKAAIVHDWDEAVLLDIPSSSPSYKSYFKEVDIREMVKKAEAIVMSEMKNLVKGELDADFMNVKLSEKEAAVLDAADITAVLIEVLEWRYLGLKYDWFDYIWSNTFGRLKKVINEVLPELKEMLGELSAAYEKGTKPSNPFLTKPEFQSFKGKNI